jgi:hypothetical protein
MDSMSPEPYVKNTDEGVKKVQNSNGLFAFFMESAGIEYAMQRDCSLVQLGVPLDSKGFGIGFRKGFQLNFHISIKKSLINRHAKHIYSPCPSFLETRPGANFKSCDWSP